MPADDGDAARLLRRTLWARIVCASGGDVSPGDSVHVDARCGRELPTTHGEALDLAVLLGARGLVWRGETTTVSHDEARERERASRLTLGPGVSGVRTGPGDGVTVEFHHRLAPLPVPVELAPLVRDAQAAPVVDVVLRLRGEGALSDLRALERRGVVTLTGPEREPHRVRSAVNRPISRP